MRKSTYTLILPLLPFVLFFQNAILDSFFLAAFVALVGLSIASAFFFFRQKQKNNQLLLAKNEEIWQQKDEIDQLNEELRQKNISLDLLNKKLVGEMAERESLEKSSFARDRFLATMSHEMRNPLNIIKGLTHFLLESGLPPAQSEQLRSLQYATNDLVVLINDILDFSKIEAVKLDLDDHAFNMAAAFREICRNFEMQADNKALLFHYAFDAQIPATVIGDHARFHQILTNLLDNILQHTLSGIIKTAVSLRELKPGEVIVQITIEGTDGGIERNILEKSLKPWQDAETEFAGYGSEGLSLAITKRLIELQHGQLDLETTQGKSTAFKILLPFKRKLEENEQENLPDKKDFSNLAGARILLVEDNKINRLVVAKLLHKMGMEVTTANDGLEGLEIFERQPFDLVLMDIQMPEMDGYQATMEIRRHANPLKREVPIIALTASAFLTEKEKAVLFGMNDHVRKPFSPEELLEKISTCLRVHRTA